MRFGISRIINQYGEDGEVVDINLVHEGTIFSTFKQYKVRHMIHSPQEATAVILRFSADMKEKRDTGLLATVKGEPSTEPNFTIRYPKSNTDGSYTVITSWTEKQ